ncbi:peptide-methionine (S)-S-oxide reductase MsrA [Flavobacterium sp. SM15]|uniref:peptide-methionine (S)-S-oxide reductase MsrA n=1 Tax=Flavobacterium sp. SM15 TaxID=2908005 RepID=UPI001EDC3475|nr:peptide-methionine (S)-S-oxide reductase MsrA [Flavobacterium sp. SM15]MCG2611883.1 peptide-methionine (S)-S-oxide reductase MsrA [Flavobacterium sp. SM15]
MKAIFAVLISLSAISCQPRERSLTVEKNKQNDMMSEQKGYEIATVAGGCFWCTEALFLELKGVKKVVPGYTGGTVKNPTYEDVCSGTTGHAEAIEITFDPKEVAYEDILEVFFGTHDPTTLNRQGADVGTQYRSEVFYHNEAQKKAAENFINLLNTQNVFGKKVVTKISQADVFYPAEDYHQNYYNRNKNQMYCMAVITPKLEKLHKNYKSKLK